MCLAVPGKVMTIDTSGAMKMGTVSFAGIEKQICLEWVPEAVENDYVIVHVGFAISRVDETDALETIEMLRQMGALDSSPPVT